MWTLILMERLPILGIEAFDNHKGGNSKEIWIVMKL